MAISADSTLWQGTLAVLIGSGGMLTSFQAHEETCELDYVAL